MNGHFQHLQHFPQQQQQQQPQHLMMNPYQTQPMNPYAGIPSPGILPTPAMSMGGPGAAVMTQSPSPVMFGGGGVPGTGMIPHQLQSTHHPHMTGPTGT